MKKLKALGNRVLIKIDAVKEEKLGILAIPKIRTKFNNRGDSNGYEMIDMDSLEMSQDNGIIIEFGPEVDKQYLGGAKVGDRVLFTRHEGAAKKYDSLYRLIPDSLIWGLIVDDEE